MRNLRLTLWLIRNWWYYRKIKSPLIRRWLRTLVSYPERQGFQRLRKGDKMCCLGQLCDLYHPTGWRERNDGEHEFLSPKGEFAYACLPDDVVNAAGFTSDVATINDEDAIDSLAGMNDLGTTWPQIATFVVRNQEYLFA